MTITPNIQFLATTNHYELVVPDTMRSALGLKDKDGNPLSIQSENKMQLEWLSQSIVKSFNKLNDVRVITRKKLAKNKRVCVTIIATAAIAAVFKNNIASLLHTSTMYVTLCVFGIAVIACLQLLKFVALGYSDVNRGDFSSDPEVEQIKELIAKDYSV